MQKPNRFINDVLHRMKIPLDLNTQLRSLSKLILHSYIERQNLYRIQTSRNLLDSDTKPLNQGTLVAMGGVDFNQFPDTEIQLTKIPPDDYAQKRSIQRTGEKIKSFKYLPYSKKEIQNIASYYQKSQRKQPIIISRRKSQ